MRGLAAFLALLGLAGAAVAQPGPYSPGGGPGPLGGGGSDTITIATPSRITAGAAFNISGTLTGLAVATGIGFRIDGAGAWTNLASPTITPTTWASTANDVTIPTTGPHTVCVQRGTEHQHYRLLGHVHRGRFIRHDRDQYADRLDNCRRCLRQSRRDVDGHTHADERGRSLQHNGGVPGNGDMGNVGRRVHSRLALVLDGNGYDTERGQLLHVRARRRTSRAPPASAARRSLSRPLRRRSRRLRPPWRPPASPIRRRALTRTANPG